MFNFKFFKTRKENSENYDLAIKRLDRIKKKLMAIEYQVPGEDEISYVEVKKNEWVALPSNLAFHVMSMSISNSFFYQKIFVHLGPQGFIRPHIHQLQDQLIQVIDGEVLEVETGKIFKAGESFLIKKGSNHFLSCIVETYLIMTFTKNNSQLVLPSDCFCLEKALPTT